jgi:hypothetical protein
MKNYNRLAHGYFFAKNYIINKGYGTEIDWQDEIKFEELTEQRFLQEFCWVVIASGLNDQVVRKLFPLIKSILFDFNSAYSIYNNSDECYENILKVFNHPGKAKAMLYAANYVFGHSFSHVKSNLSSSGVNYIKTFPYMGEATSFHLAKNIGLNVAKPDRHLVRMSSALGFESVNILCSEISNLIEENISLIDLVLWRYATLDKNYIDKLLWLKNRE